MARIRTIKPDFFRHEALQDLERNHPGNYIMLVFAALWGHCDKNGTFQWKPRTLKLDILPFLEFDMEQTLDILWRENFLVFWEAMGKQWGSIRSFPDHQRISGKELQSSTEFPQPPDNPPVWKEKQRGSNGEAMGKHPESQEGKGREQEKEGKGVVEKISLSHPLQKYIAENCPEVSKLKVQLTEQQAIEITKLYSNEFIKKVLEDMENKPGFSKNYRKVGTTLKNWCITASTPKNNPFAPRPERKQTEEERKKYMES